MSAVLWRRLDAPGHDACRLVEAADGPVLEGAAVFRVDAPCFLAYRVCCDRAWRTRSAEVRGWVGERTIAHTVRRDGGWQLDDRPVAGLADCLDVDLVFTPATNALPLRRLALRPGGAAEVAAAWLDPAAGTLTRLAQRYTLRHDGTVRYEAPELGFEAILEVGPDGWVRRYAGLWEVES